MGCGTEDETFTKFFKYDDGATGCDSANVANSFEISQNSCIPSTSDGTSSRINCGTKEKIEYAGTLCEGEATSTLEMRKTDGVCMSCENGECNDDGASSIGVSAMALVASLISAFRM